MVSVVGLVTDISLSFAVKIQHMVLVPMFRKGSKKKKGAEKSFKIIWGAAGSFYSERL